jgi:drug/metabolite transporter (DMT)-like permease
VPLWVLLSLGAAFLQNLRSALQKALTPKVGVLGAAYARFLFAAPWAVLLVAGLAAAAGAAPPRPTLAFAAWGLVGAVAQIAATLLLLHVFSLRNFAVGNTFAKTETVQAALIGLLLLGDRIAPLPLAGILVSLAGVVLLSATRGLGGGVFNRAAGLGVLSGGAFALSGIAYRAAALALPEGGGMLMRPAFTLACVTVAQTVLMSLYLARREPETLGDVVAEWRLAAPVGAAGMLASLGWFTAFTLVTVAQVKAVGQVELVFSWLTARFAFGERPSLRETAGIGLVAGGIVLLILTS